MTDQDPAFLWETEAIRSAPHRVAEAEADATSTGDAAGRWVTLRHASRETGIPVETLRKWARRATIPTYLVPADRGTTLRMVDLDGVTRRAAELGRLDRSTASHAAPGPATTVAPQQPPPAPTQDIPSGSMIVPVDAWNKMLNQLGNLHEAGHQLAEARERAARAETEAHFLRERLAELRQTADAQPAMPATPSPEPSPAPEPPPPTEKVWQFLVRRARGRRPG